MAAGRRIRRLWSSPRAIDRRQRRDTKVVNERTRGEQAAFHDELCVSGGVRKDLAETAAGVPRRLVAGLARGGSDLGSRMLVDADRWRVADVVGPKIRNSQTRRDRRFLGRAEGAGVLQKAGGQPAATHVARDLGAPMRCVGLTTTSATLILISTPVSYRLSYVSTAMADRGTQGSARRLLAPRIEGAPAGGVIGTKPQRHAGCSAPRGPESPADADRQDNNSRRRAAPDDGVFAPRRMPAESISVDAPRAAASRPDSPTIPDGLQQ